MTYKPSTSATRVYSTDWNTFPAWAIESTQLRIITVPSLGAKIVSLFDRVHNQEWLLQPSQVPLRSPVYGEGFTEYGLFGWDEMFPSIQSCTYPGPGKYYGKLIPDHGELWTLPWQILLENDTEICLQVTGEVLPYRLIRCLSIGKRPNEFTLSYQIINTSEEPIYGLWSAHPQFVAASGDQIILPPEVRQVFNARSYNGWGAIENPYTWPGFISSGDKIETLDRVKSPDNRSCRKFFINPNQPVQYAGVSRPEFRSVLWLRWDFSELPYLGIWVDEGNYSHETVIALEPSNGYMDILTDAYQRGRIASLSPGMTRTWKIRVELTHKA